MKSDLAWHLGGVRRQALGVAREAAHRCGMSIDEWLDRVILDSARQQGLEPSEQREQQGVERYTFENGKLATKDVYRKPIAV